MSRPWMPLYVGDFLADTMHLNCQETGAYIRLLMHAWQHEGLIPDDNDLLARIVRCHPPHWPRLRKVVEPFFDLTKTPGSWYSKRLSLELNKAAEISNKRKVAALQKHATSTAIVLQLHPHLQSQQKKEDSLPDGRSKYAFEDGVVKLTAKDFLAWQKIFSHLDLASALMARSQWAGTLGKKWFHPMKAALAKANQEAKERKEHLGSKPNPAQADLVEFIA